MSGTLSAPQTRAPSAGWQCPSPRSAGRPSPRSSDALPTLTGPRSMRCSTSVHPWFSIKNQWHDDRWQPTTRSSPGGRGRRDARRSQRINRPRAEESSSRFRREERPARPGRHGMPSLLGGPPHQPAGPGPSPRHLQVCLRHGIWLSGTEHRSSASVTAPTSWTPSARPAGCSAAAPSNSSSTLHAAPRKPVNDPGSAGQRRSSRRTPGMTESSSQAMFQAAAYPDAITAAAGALHRQASKA